MIIKRLQLYNYRVFRGVNTFDMTPSDHQPIVLFGGLNGAGKTSILSAIKLAFYGRTSLGRGVSSKGYDAYLIDNIHRGQGAGEAAKHAYVELVFDFASDGEVQEYRVRRHWSTSNFKTAREELEIACGDDDFSNFEKDDRERFLRSIMPEGLSDLFFFDGEKIASLAEDEDGSVLKSSIQSLLGLNILTRLSADLSIWERNEDTKGLDKKHKELIEQEGVAIKLQSWEIEKLEEKISEKKKTETALLQEKARLESSVLEKGGVFAKSRATEEAKQKAYLSNRKQYKADIKKQLGGFVPFLLAEKVLDRLNQTLKAEVKAKQAHVAVEGFSAACELLEEKSEDAFGKQTVSKLSRLIAEIRAEYVEQHKGDEELTFDFSDSEYRTLDDWSSRLARQSRQELTDLTKKYLKNENLLAQSGKRLERAPKEEVIKSDLESLSEINQKLGALDEEIASLRDQVNQLHLKNAESERRTKELLAENRSKQRKFAAHQRVGATREMLKGLEAVITESRLERLEKEFDQAFRGLARKEDLDIHCAIDRESFSVTMSDFSGSRIDKREISAGEQQIYAISMLKALGRVSGSRLPVIIDTPLGRLDSRHRGKLVSNYFPSASHQVIILSTDTEIDERYLEDLRPHISRIYHLRFDEKEQSTQIETGYFPAEEAMANAS